MERDPECAEPVGEQDQVAQVARKPVETPDDDVAHVARLDGRQELLETGALHVLAGSSRVGDDRGWSEIAQGRVGAQLVGLALDGVALFSLLLGRHSAVGQGEHRGLLSTGRHHPPRFAARRG